MVEKVGVVVLQVLAAHVADHLFVGQVHDDDIDMGEASRRAASMRW